LSKILVVTDCDFRGSGYYYIAVPLFTKLAEMGHEVRIVGLTYEGQEHYYPFSIIPCKDTNDACAIVHNLCAIPLAAPDVIVVALDIPLQIFFHEKLRGYGKPYVAITPLENGPLCMTWAGALLNTDWVFFISELGKQEAMKAGLSKVDHLQIGIDTNFWRVPSFEEKATIRKGMGISEDEFVILTVAENQERKNLWAALSVTAKLKEMGRKVKHVLVTSPDSPYGWKLRDLSVTLGISQELMMMNKGMPLENLWSLYAMSDCFLLTSKAEGLGMPVLEAMATGVPVVGTDTGAITELLSDHKGFPISPDYVFTDVWGNSERRMINIRYATNMIETMFLEENKPLVNSVVKTARAYTETRTWDIPAKQLDERIKELTSVQAQP
jgi:glycosyltransferase involved in cell wall biosynthesis